MMRSTAPNLVRCRGRPSTKSPSSLQMTSRPVVMEHHRTVGSSMHQEMMRKIRKEKKPGEKGRLQGRMIDGFKESGLLTRSKLRWDRRDRVYVRQLRALEEESVFDDHDKHNLISPEKKEAAMRMLRGKFGLAAKSHNRLMIFRAVALQNFLAAEREREIVSSSSGGEEKTSAAVVFPGDSDPTRHMLRDRKMERLLDQFARSGSDFPLSKRDLFLVLNRNHPDMPPSFSSFDESDETQFGAAPQWQFLVNLFNATPAEEVMCDIAQLLTDRQEASKKIRDELQMWAPTAARFLQSSEFMSLCSGKDNYVATRRWLLIFEGRFNELGCTQEREEEYASLSRPARAKFTSPRFSMLTESMPTNPVAMLGSLMITSARRFGGGDLLDSLAEDNTVLEAKCQVLWYDMDYMQKAAIAFHYSRPLVLFNIQVCPQRNFFHKFRAANKWRNTLNGKDVLSVAMELWDRLTDVERLKFHALPRDYHDSHFPLLEAGADYIPKKVNSMTAEAEVATKMTTLTDEDLQKITVFDDDDADDEEAGDEDAPDMEPSRYFPRGLRIRDSIRQEERRAFILGNENC